MDMLTRSLLMASSGKAVVLYPVTCTGSITATFTLNTNGSAGVTGNPEQGFTWLLRGSASDYEASYTLTSGTALDLSAGTWYGLSTTRNFKRMDTPAGTTVVQMRIRHIASGTIVAQAEVTLTTTVDDVVAHVSPTSNTTEFDSATINSTTFTCSASGGIGGYSYSWSKVSGGAIGFASGSTSSTAIFQATGMAPGESRTASFRCTVTASTGADVSNTVSVTLRRP